MNTLGDVKKRVRSLVGDPDGDFTTDAYLLPLINQAYDEAFNYLANTCAPYVTQLVVLPNLPQGLTDLQEYQVTGKPLGALINPLKLEFKAAGTADTNYQFCTRFDILPNVSPLTPPPTSGVSWEYRSFVIYLTPLPFPCDMRVRGDFKPAELVKDNDPIAIHPNLHVALAYSSSALVGMERQNQNYIQNYGPRAMSTLDDISAELVRQQQGTTSRLGRMNRRTSAPSRLTI